ncbi:hypothetical protein PMO31116_00507 [Pandoraea morbifera]|uniref:Uncharacterized protein n=1 Tax=Pandoraea morbifera TaxID=2508300 RepID=A0A5E4S0M1_9BURK|nr:hypothetical protein [Pandoraea morbifera]VVD69137.1 hypothetical protein PMO31116_00507 [Pandoraea morbifera]
MQFIQFVAFIFAILIFCVGAAITYEKLKEGQFFEFIYRAAFYAAAVPIIVIQKAFGR